MESVAPPIRLISQIKRSIEHGQSVKLGLLSYLREETDSFSAEVAQWLTHYEHGLQTKSIIERQPSIYRKSLLSLLEKGLAGQSIYQSLILLEDETVLACMSEQNRFINRLPFILMLPLLFFLFPAFLILMFGPLLLNFVSSMGGQGL